MVERIIFNMRGVLITPTRFTWTNTTIPINSIVSYSKRIAEPTNKSVGGCLPMSIILAVLMVLGSIVGVKENGIKDLFLAILFSICIIFIGKYLSGLSKPRELLIIATPKCEYKTPAADPEFVDSVINALNTAIAERG
jgi:hypothetical protein